MDLGEAFIVNPFVPNIPFLYSLKKSYGLLMFLGYRERVDWGQIG